MYGNSTPGGLAARFSVLAERHGGSTAADRVEQAQRKLMAAIAAKAPATLGEVANAVGRGAPAVSRSVDSLVRAGLVERTQDPDNRRRLALRLSDDGQARLNAQPTANRGVAAHFARLAHSELRAIERAFQILERRPG